MQRTLDIRAPVGENGKLQLRYKMKHLASTQSRIILVAILAALFGACSSGKSLPPLDVDSAGIYRLDSGDRIRIVVFGLDDLTGSYTVDGSGVISMPLIPDVVARGLSTAELEEAVSAELKKGVVRNPSVSAEIETFRPFFILGEVQQPGQYPYVHGMTVLTAVAIAGGFSERAQKSFVSITRTVGESAVEARAERNTLVRPGDVIYVLERFF